MPGNAGRGVLARGLDQIVDHLAPTWVDAVERYLCQQAPRFVGGSADHHQAGMELAELPDETWWTLVPRDQLDLPGVPLPHNGRAAA